VAVCQSSSNAVTINHLPNEMLLEIFDTFREGDRGFYTDPQRTKFLCFILTHVCRRWRAIIFDSTTRLDLHITVGPERPRHLRTVLSGPLPIFIDYNFANIAMTKSSVWRLRSALKKHGRVRRISFSGPSAWFDEIFSATNCTFPLLESVDLYYLYGQDLEIPGTFLGGPDLSKLRLQRLGLHHFPFKSISRLLLSASNLTRTLTDLELNIDAFGIASPETTLLACLQGMPFLCRLNLLIAQSTPLKYLSQPLPPQTTLKNSIVPLTKLTWFHYLGHSGFLDAIVAGLSAPALSNAKIMLYDNMLSPIVHFPRFINEMKKHWRIADVSFGWSCRFSFKQPERSWMHFELAPEPGGYPESVMQMSGALSSKLIFVEELRIFVSEKVVESGISWHKFFQHFPNVKVIQTGNADPSRLAVTLLQDFEKHVDDLAFLPSLEEIKVGPYKFGRHESQSDSEDFELAVFDPFISARQQIGHPVKVCFVPQAEPQLDQFWDESSFGFFNPTSWLVPIVGFSPSGMPIFGRSGSGQDHLSHCQCVECMYMIPRFGESGERR
jgi:hypothetical protein